MFEYRIENKEIFIELTYSKSKIYRFINFIHYKLKKLFYVKEIIKQAEPFEFISFFNIRNNTLFDGYWQNPLYFDKYKKDIIKQFVLKRQSQELINVKKVIDKSNYCSLHIRHGDYINFYNNSILPMKYYYNAMKIIKNVNKNINFLIFSDDTKFCKKIFSHDDCYFINEFGDFNDKEQLEIMSHCKYHIIANSSYSWWGAYLSDSKCVVCPLYKHWDERFYLHNWYKVNVNIL